MSADIKLWVVGSLGIDTITTKAGRFPDLLGGSISFAAAAASRFVKTGVVGVVGKNFPTRHMERLRELGLDLCGLELKEGDTFRWEGVYENDMVNRYTVDTALGVLEGFSPDLPESYRSAPFVLLGNIEPRLQLHALEQVDGKPFVAIDSMNLWINTTHAALIEAIGRSDLLTLNDCEARELSGYFNLMECGQALLDLGPEFVVIKKGEHGSLLFSADKLAIVPSYPVRNLCDPTGAGDSYIGTLMGFLASQGKVDFANMRQALWLASAAASFCVESFSIDSLEGVTIADIEQRTRELVEMASK